MQYYGSDLEGMAQAENYYQWVYDEFFTHISGTCGEIGAGCGNFSEFLRKAPDITQLKLYEPSENMYPMLKERFKESKHVSVNNCFFGINPPIEDDSFNTLVYVNVLEHIEKDEEALQMAFNALAAGGKLLIFVPALPFLFSKFDDLVGHYRRYTKRTLHSVVEKSGFTVQKLHYFYALGMLPWFLFFVLLRKTEMKGNVYAYDHFIIPKVRWIEEKLRPMLGKNLLLVAEKK